MKLPLLTLSAACFVLVAASTFASAKAWRGITPLRSTRADLTKAFGKSPDENYLRANYDVEGEHAYVVFSSGLDFYPECASSLPFDTVVLIEVTPKSRKPLSAYVSDLSRFRVVDPSSPPNIGYKGYIDETEGVVYLTFEDLVEQIDYYSSKEDRHLCPRYPEEPETLIGRFVDFFPTVDEYGVVKFNEERARLDNFGIQLQNATKSKGYIIVYPGGKINEKMAATRGKRAYEYVVNRIKVPKDRVELVMGPRQDRFSVQLNMYPKDVKPNILEATPAPTVDTKKKKP